MKQSFEHFGFTKNGTEAVRVRIENNDGASLSLINYGASIHSLLVPEKNGSFVDVCLGYNTLASYESSTDYVGATVGRCANRIGRGRFILGGKEYKLAVNDPPNHLHGGESGFSKRMFAYKAHSGSVEFKYTSLNEEEGYPGAVEVLVRYSLSQTNQVIIEFEAECDRDTIINLTNHAYFNLNGEGNGDILNHFLKINSNQIMEIDEYGLPTGAISDVESTPFDFREPTSISSHINENHKQLINGSGYDHNYILNRDDENSPVAELYSMESGIKLTVSTTKPGMQLYTGNRLSSVRGKTGKYEARSGLCLETQHFPDAINHKHFPSVILKKGERYMHQTVYAFSII